MKTHEIRSDVRLVEANDVASRRTRNHIATSNGVVGGFSEVRREVLVLDHQMRPLAWLPLDEVEVV